VIELTAHGLAKVVVMHWRNSDNDSDIANRSTNSVAREVEKTIASTTARRWLHKLGFKYKEYRKGIYNDGHERSDVKPYRDSVFLPRIASYEGQFIKWDDNLHEVSNPGHQSGEIQPVILVTQDECTFNSNDGKHFIWVHSENKPVRKKRRDQGLHISDFLTLIGRLGDGEACVTLKCGGDTWWTGDRLLDQVINKAIPAFEAQFPACKALFDFENSRNHLKFADNALRVSKMNLEPGGSKMKIMHDTYVLDDKHADGGYVQLLALPDGSPKGLKIVLMERGLWPISGKRFLTQCAIKSASGKSTKLNPRCLNGGTCCARVLLAAQPDFRNQKSQVEEAILNAGHDVIFYPAFHCELNFIEYFWGVTKRYTRENCKYDFESLKRLVPEALAGVSKELIWKYWARTERIMDPYRSGVIYASPESDYLVSRRYDSHRRISEAVET